MAQLRREIAAQRRRIVKQQLTPKQISERTTLERELFMLKNQRLIEAGRKAKRLSRRFGRGILKTGEKIAPVIKRQSRLIRQQQLRDDAIQRKLAKRRPRKKKKTQKRFDPIGEFNF
ncbi:hypothetical protein LCGC14_0651920 [marine sediment metagenome]|uniref:Uncharacterized protein n=1 Tax=marine sediment metagenome TaxID=412755 RepID=A0A0F9R171_9ZZZZ